MPLAFDRALFVTPAPEMTTLVPRTRFFPAVTLTVTRSGLPSALIIFGDTVSVRQNSGWGCGCGFATGGLSGAGTTVIAESTLSAGFVSRPPPPVTVAVLVCVPTVVARAVTRMTTVWPFLTVPRLQVMSDGATEHVPCVGLALR